MKIRYFDFGLHTGTELMWVQDILPKFGDDYEIYGFEACKKYYDLVKSEKQYKLDKKHTKIYHLAISATNEDIKLYHHKNSVGHSIYDSKNGIAKDSFEIVKGVKFSDWLNEQGIILEDSFNIIRVNIEGAEYDMFNDIIENNLHSKIAIFCGDGKDTAKIGELVKSGKARNHHKKLLRLGIKIHRYVDYKPEGNVDLEELITAKMDTVA